ncbi:MAG: hypothetical protein EAZ90_11955 [Oscillatoriales cyanobacterium]|nr:MAG: hypothetical protein EAZ94_07075 [Oscillatoriales cyanobacterium]TAE26706.1 MAG: hypothetical protein EAZ93_07310 [Oscillatoriales cyanobacterium]TAE43099.1 MAG: hypothetical protein EAZ90_11955 [Oscillatoriales cyanobacterium]TAE55804.1 MAG: hypothetical protein EAZ88_05575 [Oscillatoriales cyanobacterium]TAE70651.1 MAG: hypothetical protein EAZ86_05895 [Oscillatoriales cyanobacterium]
MLFFSTRRIGYKRRRGRGRGRWGEGEMGRGGERERGRGGDGERGVCLEKSLIASGGQCAPERR